MRRHHIGRLQGRQIDDRALHLRELRQAHFGARRLHGRTEPDLGQPALQRHLAAFEADLVIAALAGALTLDAAAAGLALAGGGAASDPQAVLLGPCRGRHFIHSHDHQTCSTFSRCTAALIMPRFCGVSITATLWCGLRSPRPRTEATMLASCPLRLLTSVTFTEPGPAIVMSSAPSGSCRAWRRSPRASAPSTAPRWSRAP